MAANKNKSSQGDNEPHESAGTDVSGGTNPEGSGQYRAALRQLALLADQGEGLTESRGGEVAEVERLKSERARLLEQSVSSPREVDDEESVALISRLGVKAERAELALERTEAEIIVLAKEMAAVRDQLTSGLASLGRSFYWWKLGQARERISAELAPGRLADHILQLVASCHRSVVSVRALEIASDLEPRALVEAGEKLLEAVEKEPGFALPPWPENAPTAPAAAVDHVGLPWLDRGMTVAEIEGELTRIRLQDASLDVVGSYRRLKELHPELFVPPSQNEPLFETPKQEWKAEMIGDTVPV